MNSKIKQNSIKSIDYLHYFVFSLLLLTNIMFFNNNIFILYLSIIYFLVVTFLNFSNGLILFVISLPANQIMTKNITTVNYVFILMVLIIGVYFLKYFGKKNTADKKSFIYILVFLFFNILALILNAENINNLLSFYGMLVISMTFLYLYINEPNKKDLYSKSKFAFVLSAINILVLLLHFNNWDFTGFTNRIYIDDIISIRRVADFLAPAIIILFSGIFFNKSRHQNKLIVLGKLLVLISLIYFLLLTATRGVFYAVIISMIITMFIYIFRGFKISYKGISSLLVIILSSVLIIYFANFLPEFTSRLLDIDNQARFNIWSNGLKQMNFSEFIFGRGLNRFWELSQMGNLANYFGEGYTAHSLYLDVLTSSGIVSLVLLLSTFCFLLKSSFVNKDYLSLFLTLYLVIAAITGIPVINISFWTLIGIIYISRILNSENTIKEVV